MLKYKVDIFLKLKGKGYNQAVLQGKNIVGGASIVKINHGDMIGIKELDKLCRLLDCQPGDLIYYEREDGTAPPGGKM